MQIFDDLAHIYLNTDTVLTIGAFDGVHRGHQHLIQQMMVDARRESQLTALLTFHPHPSAVLNPENPPKYLTTPGQKAALLERLGLDVLVILPFDRQLADTSADDFVPMIAGPLRVRDLWIGSDFALGRGRDGNVFHLADLGRQFGFAAHVVPPYVWNGEIISSTRIRNLLRAGKVDEAATLLNRYYSLAGEVVHGAGRGHQFGIPTANLEVRANRATPTDGIYAVYAVLGEERYWGVANIGRRPSFDNGERTIEVHILDFKEDIYGCDLAVEFVKWLRPELRFDNITELYHQIDLDIQQTRDVLAQETPYPRPLLMTRYQPIRSYRKGPDRFEELSYTADVGIRAYGQNLKELFVNAACGLSSLMSDVDGLFDTTWHSIEVSAPDLESLLLNWLGELLYLHDTTREILIDFEIEELSDTYLRGSVYGTHLAQAQLEIKAVTYHDLKIERTEQGYTATVVFDV
jgi:riboflavin kinase / FMN adenylyltransferase